MKQENKVLALLLCAVLLVGTSVMGTLAYLTSQDQVVNTFTVGKVEITLDEADVDENGQYVTNHDSRVKTNAYHLLPGHTYYKDPTVTVLNGSEESFVRMMVTVNYSNELDAIFAPDGVDLMDIFTGYDSTQWALNGITKDAAANTRTYEFRYVGADNKGTKAGTVAAAMNGNIVLDDLFEGFTIPDGIDQDQLATLVTTNESGNITSQFTITVVANAIQADGFADADAAWAAFN